MKKKLLSIALVLALCTGLAVPTLAFVEFSIPDYWGEGVIAIADSEPISISEHESPSNIMLIYTFHLGTTIVSQLTNDTEPDENGFIVSRDLMILTNPIYVAGGEWQVDSENFIWEGSYKFETPGLYAWQIQIDRYNPETRDGATGFIMHFLVNILDGDDTQTPAPLDDTPSTWAAPEVNAAIAAGLVPQELQRNYQREISRGSVAQMFINLIEKASGMSIDDFMAEKGVTVNESAFTDTTDRAVLAANALGIIQGVGNNQFDPDGIFKRAHVAVIINRVARVLGVDTNGYTHSFTDVQGHWADPELGWPVHAEIIEGVGNNRFDPEGNLTTEMVIMITYRALAPLSD